MKLTGKNERELRRILNETSVYEVLLGVVRYGDDIETDLRNKGAQGPAGWVEEAVSYIRDVAVNFISRHRIRELL